MLATFTFFCFFYSYEEGKNTQEHCKLLLYVGAKPGVIIRDQGNDEKNRWPWMEVTSTLKKKTLCG